MNKANSSSPQFGPVNTYHLTASLKARIGDYKDHPIDLVCDDDGIFYEWSHYSIAQFVEEWPLEMFK